MSEVLSQKPFVSIELSIILDESSLFYQPIIGTVRTYVSISVMAFVWCRHPYVQFATQATAVS